MKIRKIRAVGLRGATPEGGWSEELKPDDSIHTLVAVITDEGLTGFGSAFTNDDLVRAALAILEPLYKGENPLEPERVTEKLRQNSFWMGRGGSITHAISGVDIALWDILGKATGQPIGRLLGGRYRDKVRPYASVLMREPAEMKEVLSKLKEEKFSAFKIGWGPFGVGSFQKDRILIQAAREAVGSDSLLMVDGGGSNAFSTHTFKWALRTAHMLADYNVYWFEEPMKPDALEDHILLRQQVAVPIAGGEVLTRRQSFLPWLQGHAYDIVQPDVTKVGGITESRRIAWMAQDNGARMIPHGWNTAVGLAADLQLASAISDTDLVEYIAGSAYVDEIPAKPWELDANGMLDIPDGPGLGVDFNMDAIAKYTPGQKLLS